jgi:hypothetical protein
MNKTQLKKRKLLLAALKRPEKLSDAELKSRCTEALRYIDDLECRCGAYMELLDTVVPCFDFMDKALHRFFKNIGVIQKRKKKASTGKSPGARRVANPPRLLH